MMRKSLVLGLGFLLSCWLPVAVCPPVHAQTLRDIFHQIRDVLIPPSDPLDDDRTDWGDDTTDDNGESGLRDNLLPPTDPLDDETTDWGDGTTDDDGRSGLRDNLLPPSDPLDDPPDGYDDDHHHNPLRPPHDPLDDDDDGERCEDGSKPMQCIWQGQIEHCCY